MCLIREISNIDSFQQFKLVTESEFAKKQLLSLPLVVTFGTKVPFTIKSVIDDSSYILVVSNKYFKLSPEERFRLLLKEFDKIFFADYKALSVTSNAITFLKDFGISIVVWQKVSQFLRQRGATNEIRILFISTLASLFVNFILDATIVKLINRSAYKRAIESKYLSKLGCSGVSVQEHSMVYEGITETIIRYLIIKLKNITSLGCKVIGIFYRLAYKVFGKIPYVDKLLKLMDICDELGKK